jgi:DNA repair protein RadC
MLPRLRRSNLGPVMSLHAADAMSVSPGLSGRPLSQVPRRPSRRSAGLEAQDLQTLADAELLQVALGPRMRECPEALAELLRRDGFLALAAWDATALQQVLGLAAGSATVLAAVVEVGRRLARGRRGDRPPLQTAEQVARLVGGEMALFDHEEFWCLPLDARSRLIGPPRVVSRGDVDGTEADPRAFFRHAFLAGAVSAIAVHNHPSGDPQPSAADRAVTSVLFEAGRAVHLPLVDHIVIGDGGRFCSIRRESPQLFRGALTTAL